MNIFRRLSLALVGAVLVAACEKSPDIKGKEVDIPGKARGSEQAPEVGPGTGTLEKIRLPLEYLQNRGGAERAGGIEGPAPTFPLRVVREWNGKNAIRTPAIATADLVFFSDTGGTTYCLRRPGGEPLWSFKAESPVFAPGACRDGLYFIADTGGRVYALDVLTGSPRWKAETGGRVIAAPLLDNGRVFVGNEKGGLTALDEKNGTSLWTRKFPHAIYAAPSAGTGAVFIGTEGGFAVAVSAADGSILWQESVSGPVFGSLVFHRDYLLGGTLSGGYFALDAKTGGRIWEQKMRSVFFASPAVNDGFAVFTDLEGRVFSVDTRSGLIRWRVTLSGPVPFSPLLVDGKVLAASETSFVYLLDEFTGEMTGRAGLPGRVTSDPVSLDGLLYIGTAEGKLLVMEGLSGASEVLRPPMREKAFDSFYYLPPDGGDTEILLSPKGQNLHFTPRPGGMYFIELADEPLRPVTVKILDRDGAVLESNFEYSAMTRGFSFKFDGQRTYNLHIEPVRPEEGMFPVRIRARFIGVKS